MTASGSTYTTNSNIPAQTAGTTVYYVIDATDDDSATTTSSEQSYTVIAPATTTIPYTEDFSAGWGQTYRYDVAGTKPWYIYNNDNASCNGYGSTLEEHWLVLPGINFNNYSNERMTFNTIATYGVIDANNYLKLMYSSNYSGLGDPSSATWTEISFTPAPPQDPGPGIETSSGVLDLSGISGTNVYLAFKYYSTNQPTRWDIDDINIYLATPLITVNPTTLTGFTYQGTGPSTAQTFTVSGTDLTADIILTAPTNYEISLSETTGYTSSLTLTAAKLGVAETTIYVRLKAGLSVGNYNNEVITASSTGATSKTVTCSGEVFTATAVPFCHWNFNTNPPTSPANWTAPIASNSGTGSLTYTFDYATSYTGETLNAAFGDAAGGSFAPVAGTNQVNNGEEFVMTVDTSGRENIVMTYATRGTSTGFTTQEIYYSVDDGANFILFDTLTGMNVATWSVQTMDFSTITGANNNNSFKVKIVVSGATSDSGNNRFDNILFFGDANASTPVELSSFTATISAQNYITLTWVTQTETGMRGYYIYRGTESGIAGAQNVSPLIPSLNSSQMQTYMFEDTEVYETGTYYYWLQTNDLDGTVNYHGPVSVFYNSLGDNPTPEIPLATKLHAVYPNPFNPLVFIPFSLAKDNDVSFKIYNSRGQIVKHFDLGNKAPGNYRITWDGTDYNGNTLSNGVYQIVMTAGSQAYQTKTTLLK
ncbi:MAG: FlgD immunoglobulin-like domain containing protein [Candidatus Cloacimonetes bacterium]|nr:FlgD immunoglobulin-like domain containing protein [Candidatus Cloacimonadota bacterium]